VWHTAHMKSPKNERINTRLPAHLRLGAELLAGKHGVSLSVIMERALADLLAREGLTTVQEGELLSLMDRLLTLQPGARVKALAEYRPDLLSAADRVWFSELQEEEKRSGRSLDDPEIEAFYSTEWGNFL
jgi:hypothetical protein